MRKTGVLILVLLLMVSMSLTGCNGDKATSESVTGPTASTLNPTGTIQGHIIDAVTQQPIVGAVVDIGVGSAATSVTGEFVIRNVPANKDALNGTVTGVYRATIDMRNVSSPVSMGTTTTPRYANFAHFDTVAVSYTSLDDTNATNPGGGSGTNHDTPVTGLVANIDFTIGKLASNINGVVAFNKTLQPVGAGYSVKLISTGSNISGGGTTGGSGNNGNVIMTTTTDANGAFSFTNVESLQTFNISAQSSDGLYTSTAYPILALADGQTKTMNIQSGVAPTTANVFTVKAVFVVPTDSIPPTVISVTPETGTDLNLTSNPSATVVFTFSEAMRSDSFSNMLASEQVFTTTVGGLYDKVAVNYLGTKASNIAHTMSWSTDRKSLTVRIPNLAPSSIYEVDISAATGTNNLADIYDNWLDPASPKLKTRFTTNGAPTAAAVANLSIVNSGSLNAGNTTGTGVQAPTLDWAPVSGAKGYNIYRQMVQRWVATTEVSPYVMIGNGSGSYFADSSLVVSTTNGMPYVENSEIQLTYNYVVRSVNSDAVESADSNVVNAVDVLSPRMTPGTITLFADLTDNNNTLVVTFNEPMKESTVTNISYWTLGGISGTVPTITGIVYNSAARTATLTLSATLNPSNVQRTYITTGANGVLDTTLVAGDAYRVPAAHGGLCISAGNANGTLATAAAVAGDFRQATRTLASDPPVGIYADLTNVCRTTVTAPDTQVVAVGSSPAVNQAGISAATFAVGTGIGAGNINNAAADFTMQSTIAGATNDDVLVPVVLLTLSNGLTDIAGNVIDTAYDQLTTDATIR